jgi:sugar/nucleoside kinase (ribokinase family)
VHADHVGYPAVRGCGLRLSVDGGNPIADLDLTEVALYAPTEVQLTVQFGAAQETTVSEPAQSRPRDGSETAQRRLRDGSETKVLLAARAAIAAGAGLVVVTRGAEGSVAATREGESIVAPGFTVEPLVSTLGAGDVFHGALLAQLVRGAALGDALAGANEIAALSCRALDGRSAIPYAS